MVQSKWAFARVFVWFTWETFGIRKWVFRGESGRGSFDFIPHWFFQSLKGDLLGERYHFSYIPSVCRNQHPVFQSSRERSEFVFVPRREKYNMQRPAERSSSRVRSNLDLFVLWSLPAAGRSVAPYRSPALPELGDLSRSQNYISRYNNASNFQDVWPNINPELNIEWKRAGRYIGLQNRPDAALLNRKPDQSPNLSRARKVPPGSQWDLMKLHR